MNRYFEMPYFQTFRIEIENTGASSCHIYYQLNCEEKVLPPDTLDDEYPAFPTPNELEII